jgi:crotonobetainyl-CoA:carnitine CoA-transferase CaiB-like acyl-CoA transferase
MPGAWNAASGATGPLSGIRVVDLTINVLGPVATQLMADAGADVIKVESPAGDQNRHIGPQRSPAMSALFLTMNRNKRSVVLNLKKPEAKKALFALAADADVFVHSMRPGAAERLGIDYATVRSHNRNIVYAYAPGYRPDGPYRERPAYDDVIQGESGIASMCARAFGEPRYFPTILADKFCGHVLACAISMALFNRERTGEGQEVVVPMLETVLSFNMFDHQWGAVFDPPDGGMGYNRLFTPHRRPYQTADGYMCIMASNDDQWHRLLLALDRPDLADDPRFAKLVDRARNIEALYASVTEAMRKRPNGEWHQRLTEADIPHAPVKNLEDLLTDSYLQETGFFRRFEHPSEGAMIAASNPMQFSRTPTSMRLPQPRLGEHSESVLKSLGFAADAVADLSS